MELNQIQSSALNWGEAASSLNQNFSKIGTDMEKMKYATTRNKGYFSSGDALKAAVEKAVLGDIAYVESEVCTPYEIWEWTFSGWVATGKGGGDAAVILGDYYNKEDVDTKFENHKVRMATDEVLGGIIAAEREDTDVTEVRIDPETGRLYTAGVTVEGNITPDEEDLTVHLEEGKAVVRFRDRLPQRGKGYVIVREGDEWYKQIKEENTIYEIRYDFDLGGGTLEVPSGCILSFNGGCFKNGTIKGLLEFRNEPKFENVRVRLDNSHNSVNKIEGYGCYVETINNNWNDAKKISDLGISYVIYYNYKVGTEAHIIDSLYDMRLFAAFGIGVILYLDCTDDMIAEVAMQFANENNLIGWYVFDEPEAHGISVGRQDTRINVLKGIKNLPCCCATNGDYYVLSPISRNYDFIYLSQYYNLLNNVELNSTSDVINAYGRVTSFIDYGIDKIYPIYETYNATKDDDYLLHNLLVKKSLYKNKGCFFIYSPEWTSNEAAIGGIKYSERLQNIVKSVIKAEVPSRNMEIKGFCLGEVDHLSKAQSLIPLNSKAIVHTNDTEQLKGYPGIYFYSTGEYVEFVFSKPMKGARLILSWQNRGNTNTQKFDVIIPINSEKGYVVSSIDITPINGKRTIYANIPVLNSDRFILKSSTINTGYQIIESLIVVGIPLGKNEVANGDIERYAIQRIGTTSERPILSSTWQFWTPDVGFMYYDLTLNKPIWWSHGGWVDVTGTQV